MSAACLVTANCLDSFVIGKIAGKSSKKRQQTGSGGLSDLANASFASWKSGVRIPLPPKPARHEGKNPTKGHIIEGISGSVIPLPPLEFPIADCQFQIFQNRRLRATRSKSKIDNRKSKMRRPCRHPGL
jgi:hypothetical protein